jgi:pimeloyl-ACP methyl ester carboxylesterase
MSTPEDHLPFASRKIEVNGIALNVIIEGEGPDVMLVHGFPDSHWVWRHQIPALVKAGYRVIAPDLRGFGDSEAPIGPSNYRLDRLVDDLRALLDALGIERVRLIGHDWGAACGWLLARAHPARVERYIAMSLGHLDAYARGGIEQKLKGWYVLFFQLPGIAEWAMRAGNWWLFRLITGSHPELAVWKREMSRPGRLTAAMGVYRANLDLLSRRNRPVKVPVMGMWSTGDRYLARGQMTESRRYVEGPWRYEEVAGVSHWLQLDAPERVNALLIDYLAAAI